MSAHCDTHGCDLVYVEGGWPLQECPECKLELAVQALQRRLSKLEQELEAAKEVAERYERYDVWQGVVAENLRLERRLSGLEILLREWLALGIVEYDYELAKRTEAALSKDEDKCT